MMELTEQGGVAVMRLGDGKANAMSLEFCEALTARFQELSSSRPVVLTGTGRIFSAGVDLLRLSEGGASYVHKFLPALCAMFASVFSHAAPVVAAINGHAIAGGCVLACAADRRLMAREEAAAIKVPVLIAVGTKEELQNNPHPRIRQFLGRIPNETANTAAIDQYFQRYLEGASR